MAANSAFGHFALQGLTTGRSSTAIGSSALRSMTSGTSNTAVGADALRFNTTGSGNAAFGDGALRDSTGDGNSAFGSGALRTNTGGSLNTAVGGSALVSNGSGTSNTAIGFGALGGNTSGSSNVAIGISAGSAVTTGSDNVYLASSGNGADNGTTRIGSPGTQTRAFVAGIRGVTTGVADAIPVLIDSSGQLGTVSSSRAVKREIRAMGDATERLHALRPVTFRYRQPQALPGGAVPPPEYGLIAEEVAEVFPDLVVYDDAGRPFTVKYHAMAPMLLNEIQKQERVIAALSARLDAIEGGQGAACRQEVR
jgi:hypothetical protein